MGGKAQLATEITTARIISGVAHASVLGLLGSPCINFKMSGAAWGLNVGELNINGYQALAGFTPPQAQTFGSDQTVTMPSFGPDPWITLLIVVAVVGSTTALFGGPIAAAASLAPAVAGIVASAVRIVTAAIGVIAAVAAVGWYPVFESQGITVLTSPYAGFVEIFAVLAIAFLSDVVGIWLWSSRGAATKESSPERRYSTLGLVSFALPFGAWILVFTLVPAGTFRLPALLMGMVPGVVTGHVAIGQIKRTGERGRWIAVIALIIGYGSALLFVLPDLMLGIWRTDVPR